MIFVTYGRSEKRHESVPAKFVESASVFKNDVDHVRQVNVEDVNGILRVKALGQWSETAQIAKDNGDLVYTTRPHNQNEASLTLTSKTPDTLVIENPKHDFPQRIIYRREKDGSMEMRVDGKKGGIDRAALYPVVRTTCES